MRFIIAVDAHSFEGKWIEQSLRPYVDIADYDIIPYWDPLPSIQAYSYIEARAERLAKQLFYDKENASDYYIGFTRGSYLYQKAIAGRACFFTVCMDYAVAIEALTLRTRSQRLNPKTVMISIEKNISRLIDNDETLDSLNELISTFCIVETASANPT